LIWAQKKGAIVAWIGLLTDITSITWTGQPRTITPIWKGSTPVGSTAVPSGAQAEIYLEIRNVKAVAFDDVRTITDPSTGAAIQTVVGQREFDLLIECHSLDQNNELTAEIYLGQIRDRVRLPGPYSTLAGQDLTWYGPIGDSVELPDLPIDGRVTSVYQMTIKMRTAFCDTSSVPVPTLQVFDLEGVVT
jgi:hypothetical protein